MAEKEGGDCDVTGEAAPPSGDSNNTTFKDPLLTGFDGDGDDNDLLETLELDASCKPDATVSPSSSIPPSFQLYEATGAEAGDLFVKVDNPEKHVTTLEAYITFRVSTKTSRSEFDSCEYSVRRRYNDFLWLRQHLEDSYPTYLVPPVPEKHSLKRLDRFSLDFVRMRQKALQKFLTRLADHPVLSCDKHFRVFLTAKAGEFQSHKKQGKGIVSQVTDSIHNMGASYMMKNRSAEFSHMLDYITIFGEKMGVLDRIAARVLREQTDYLGELREGAPCYTLWANSEDELSAALLALSKAIDQCCQCLRELIDDTDDSLVQPLKEYILYAECIKVVLRRRDAIQMDYNMVVDELNKRRDEREQVKISDQTYSIGAFMGKDPEDVKQQKQEKIAQQISDLTRQEELLSDKNEVADANLKADMDRWHKTKQRDVKAILTALADRQICYYEKSLSAWEDAIRAIQRKEKDVPVSDANTFIATNTATIIGAAVDATTSALASDTRSHDRLDPSVESENTSSTTILS